MYWCVKWYFKFSENCGVNIILDLSQGKTFQIGTELMKQVGEVTVEADGSKYSFEGYEVSYLLVSCLSFTRRFVFRSLNSSQYDIQSFWSARVWGVAARSCVGVGNARRSGFQKTSCWQGRIRSAANCCCRCCDAPRLYPRACLMTHSTVFLPVRLWQRARGERDVLHKG